MGNKVDIANSGIGGGAQVLASLDPHSQLVATSLGVALGLGFSVWSYFSDKRNKELFGDQELVNKLITKTKKSDDFASFVFDVWQKHNLESSEARRKLLKKFLEGEVDKTKNKFENFSKIEHIMQNINLRALKLLDIIYSDRVQKRKVDPNDKSDWMLNLGKLTPLVQEVEDMHEQDIEYFMSELTIYGLMGPMYGRYGGTYYIETKLGHDFIEYIQK